MPPKVRNKNSSQEPSSRKRLPGPMRSSGKYFVTPERSRATGGLTVTPQFTYSKREREGRLQSAERAVPTCIINLKDGPSFSLISCGLQAAVKGASYVPQTAGPPPPPAPPQPRPLQETRQRPAEGRTFLGSDGDPRLVRPLDRFPRPPVGPQDHSRPPRRHR